MLLDLLEIKGARGHAVWFDNICHNNMVTVGPMLHDLCQNDDGGRTPSYDCNPEPLALHAESTVRADEVQDSSKAENFLQMQSVQLCEVKCW